MTQFVYDFSDYKKYLGQVLDTSGSTRGARSRLAELLHCQSAFISQVLNGSTHFSLEHGILINDFLNHDEGERRFFMLLVQLGRAGSHQLESYFRKQIDEIRAERKLVAKRVGATTELTEIDQMTYYSAWYYSTIHVLTAIPEYRNKSAIARALNLSPQIVSDCLEFLARVGLIAESNGAWVASSKRIHLGKNSPMIGKHHGNWRVKAMQSIDDRKSENLHFSGVWSFAKQDVDRIRAFLLEAIERAEPVLRVSKDETAFGIGIDFFNLA